MEDTNPLDKDNEQSSSQHTGKKFKVWERPDLVELPRLTDLTLLTGSPIPGFGNPGTGSTVF